MDKAAYIAIINENLADCSPQEVKETVEQIEEHFSVGLEMGKTEEEIINKLGDPVKVAKEIKAYNYISRVEEKVTFSNIFRAIIATLGMGFFNLVFIIGPLVLLSMALVGIILFSIGMVLFGFGGAAITSFMAASYIDTHNWSNVFYSLSMGFGGVFCTIFSYFIIKYFIILIIKYLKLNLGIITNTNY